MNKPSIIQKDETRCYVCGSMVGLERHHAMHGTANRKIAEKYNLTVMLCREHHTGRLGVHTDPILDDRIKKDAQRAFTRIYSRGLWMRLFGKNYL